MRISNLRRCNPSTKPKTLKIVVKFDNSSPFCPKLGHMTHPVRRPPRLQCLFHVKQKGIFITFEGMDGSGKTTQMHRLAERLTAMGRNVLVTTEPGGPPIAQKVRRIILDAANPEMSPVAEVLLYFASRAQNVDEWIRPALERGEIVLSDRFTDSSLVYQGVGRGLGVDTVAALERIACRGLKPNLT